MCFFVIDCTCQNLKVLHAYKTVSKIIEFTVNLTNMLVVFNAHYHKRGKHKKSTMNLELDYFTQP